MARRALVVDLGIAGMSAALGLEKAGWEVVVVERAAQRRTGGYFIGLSKEGFEAARYFGVDGALHTRTPEHYQTWEVDESGERHPSLSFTDQPNHPEVVLRGDIEEALWTGTRDRVEVRYSTVPELVGPAMDATFVRLSNTRTGETTDEMFDLVIGADGMRSTVRRQVFGPDADFMRPVGSIICAFQLPEQVPGTLPHDGLVVAENRRSLWVFPFSDQPPTVLFTYRPEDVDAQFRMKPSDALRQAFAGMSGDGAVRFALDAFDAADSYLFDSVHTVEMPRWHHNRVVLLGDAAWCLTLYSGYGATSAMHAGAVLGKVMSEADDVDQALDQWEREMRPFVEKVARMTPLKAQLFVPSNRAVFGIRSVLLTQGVLPKTLAFVNGRKKARAQALDRIFGERRAA